LEYGFANIASYRTGHYKDPGFIDDDTEGWSVGLPLGRFGGARYDHATFPQSALSGLGQVKREGVTAYMDPIAVWGLFKK